MKGNVMRMCLARYSHLRPVNIASLLLFACALSGCAEVQTIAPVPAETVTVPAKPETDHQLLWKLLREQDRPLSAVVLMEKMTRSKQLPMQMFGQFYAFTGDEYGAGAIMDLDGRPDTSLSTSLEGYSQYTALDAIVKTARDKRIVILNESHYHQRHRAFALELAWRLRKAGFTGFAAETFGADVDKSLVNAVPTLKTGTYSIDPLFGDLIRQSLRAGYQLFDYEIRPSQPQGDTSDFKSRIAAREQAQAENIKSWLDQNPSARVFIYVGGAHGSETVDASGSEWMAFRLKRMTGIDPLTINQIAGRSKPEFDNTLFQAANALGNQSRPFVLMSDTGDLLARYGYDMVVFHPRVADIAGRPGWLVMDGYRKPVTIKFSPMPGRTLVRAYVKHEPAGRIAMDQVLVGASKTSVTLMLPAGKYAIVRQTESGDSIDIDEISVAN